MGFVKAEALRYEELQECGAEIQFQCPDCCEVIEDYAEVPPIDITAEKQSEIQQTVSTDVVCSACGADHVVDTLNTGANLVCTLQGNGKVDIHVEPPAWYYQVEEDPSFEEDLLELEPWFGEINETPFEAYRLGADELDAFINNHCEEDFVALENRMAVVQAWSLFETYLADQLTLYLDQHTDALIRFAKSDPSLKDMKLNVGEAIEGGVSLKKLVTRSAKNRLFHNFGKPGTTCKKSSGVPAWFGVGLRLPLIKDDSKLDRLRWFAVMRHDCVHRNGKSSEGGERDDVKKSAIVELRTIMDQIARHVDATISARHPELPRISTD